MDFSAAKEGYQREIHRDSDGRVMAMVVFLDDYQGAKGGDFVTYRYKNTKPLSQMPTRPKDHEVEEVSRYRPKKNFGIIFLSCPNSN